MAKLYDKDDPNQVKEDQSPYGDEVESSDDPSSAAMHGRIVRLETNAKHVATNEGVARVEVKVARVEGKVDTVKTELVGKIETVKTELVGKIETGNAKTETRFAKVDAKIEWLEKLLYVNIALHIIDFVQDSPAIANLVNLIAKLFR